MSRKRSGRRPVAPRSQSSPLSAQELAADFDYRSQLAAAQAPVVAGAPGGVVRRPVRISQGPVRTKESFERVKAEKDGFDPGLNKRFSTYREAQDYRKRNGYAEMGRSEFRSEVAGRNTSFCRRKFTPLDRNVEGFNPEAFNKAAELLSGKGTSLFG